MNKKLSPTHIFGPASDCISFIYLSCGSGEKIQIFDSSKVKKGFASGLKRKLTKIQTK